MLRNRQFTSDPHAPESNVGVAQPVEIQRMAAFRRGYGGHAIEMLSEQSGNFGPVQVINFDVHNLRWLSQFRVMNYEMLAEQMS